MICSPDLDGTQVGTGALAAIYGFATHYRGEGAAPTEASLASFLEHSVNNGGQNNFHCHSHLSTRHYQGIPARHK